MSVTQVEPIELPEAPPKGDTKSGPLIKRDLKALEHVAVTLEAVIGRASTTVGELFSLSEGDTLELDTELDGLLSLELDGKLVARGQLVAVGDHFGVRIVEVE